MNSLFDPLGFVAPIIIEGKFLLRELSSEALDWDSPLPEGKEEAWEAWRKSLQGLKKLDIPRPYVDSTLSTALRKELQCFLRCFCQSDSSSGISSCHQRRRCMSHWVRPREGEVAPQAAHTIPRLELGAAVLAAELAETIMDELDFSLDAVEFYNG